MGRQTGRPTNVQPYRHTDRDGQTGRQADKLTCRQVDIQTARQPESQTTRQADRQSEKVILSSLHTFKFIVLLVFLKLFALQFLAAFQEICIKRFENPKP